MSNIRTSTAASEFRLKGRSERAVGQNGEFNASSKNELIQLLASLVEEAKNGNHMVGNRTAEQASVLAAQHKEMVLAAMESADKHRELGEVIANELNVSANKSGFMRSFLKRQDLSQGQIPTVTMQMKNVTALVASGPTQVEPQHVRDQYFYPPEFYINANPFIEQRDISRSNTDILEQKYIESMEGIMVAEDRLWRTLAQQSIGVANDSTTVVGSLTPLALSNVRQQVTRWRVPATSLLMASDLWTDILADANFAVVLDPVSKHELFLEGQLGTMLGMAVYTDAYRHTSHQVLGRGEFWVIGSPDTHGQYTDRGGVVSEPVTQAVAGIPGRGWFMSEQVSMVLANARSVARGIRA